MRRGLLRCVAGLSGCGLRVTHGVTRLRAGHAQGRAATHRSTVGRAAGAGIDWLLTVGGEADWIADAARAEGCPEVAHFEDTTAAARVLGAALEEGDVVLVKGSRSARMERVIEEVAVL